jgi:hypothetical protein
MTDPSIHTIYTGRSTNWPLIWLSTALVLPLLVMAKGSDGSWTSVDIVVPLAVIVSAVLVNVVTASSLRATAGANGVTVHFGVFGWPRFRYPISRIQHAEAIEIPASRWACGIYWSPRRGLMLTLRTGPDCGSASSPAARSRSAPRTPMQRWTHLKPPDAARTDPTDKRSAATPMTTDVRSGGARDRHHSHTSPYADAGAMTCSGASSLERLCCG